MTLHDIQTKVHVGKDKRNDFGGYNYRTAEGILAAIKAALPDGATIIVTDAMQEVAGQIFVSATATITFEGGETVSAQGHAMHPLSKKGMDPSQITGAASSYARKYALSGLVALDDGSVDPDAREKTYEEEKTEKPPEKTPAEKRDFIKNVMEGKTVDTELDEYWKNDKLKGVVAALPEPMQFELQRVYTDRMGVLSTPTADEYLGAG